MPSRSTRWAAISGISTLAVVFSALYQPVVIVGHCMEPALKNKDLVWMDRQYYRSHPVRRGDVVVFRHRGEIYVKRVHAVGGDTIRVAHFRNGDAWLVSDLSRMPGGSRLMRRPLLSEITLSRIPRGTLFVVGDNRNVSMDSRDFGPVSVSTVIGRVKAPTEAISPPPVTVRQIARTYAAPR